VDQFPTLFVGPSASQYADQTTHDDLPFFTNCGLRILSQLFHRDPRQIAIAIGIAIE